MRAPVTVFAVLIAGVLLGCSRQDSPPPASAGAPTSPERHLAQDPEGNFVLHISNQSFAISLVDVTVLIDGAVAVRDEFDVGKKSPQHEDKRYTFNLAPGRHTIQATSKKGSAVFKQEFDMQERRWAGLTYEYVPVKARGVDPIPRSFMFAVKKEPIFID